MPCNFAAFRFCCPTGCVYESDAFDRADSTSLGAKWTETAGDWSIDTNRLKIVATADAKATCTTTHPTASTKYIVSVSITLGTDGDVARVWVDDSAFFAELERITSTCGRLRLYDGATCKGSCNVSLGGYTRLVLCVEATKVHVGTGGSPMLTVPATPASSVVALGTAACTGTVYFEDFSLSKHSVDDATCPACGNEGCTWFSDTGCASGSLSATDWTTTGTWEYSSGTIQCTADGTLTVVPGNPVASGKLRIWWDIATQATAALVGTEITVDLGAGTPYLKADCILSPGGGHYTWRIRFYSGSDQYGTTSDAGWNTPPDLALCWDGTHVFADGGYGGALGHAGSAAATIATATPRITIASLPAGQTVAVEAVTATKMPDDITGCTDCYPCAVCEPGTWLPTCKVEFTGLTSAIYGCACGDFSVTLYTNNTTCGQWLGTATLCGIYGFTIWARITAVTGGFKLTVTVSRAGVVTFENTVIGASVDCASAFDGDVPLVSATETLPCGWASATCTFTSPAP